jgi:exodeoxyribonuclease VII small subunit
MSTTSNTTTTETKTPLDFEKSLTQLENIIKEMEGGELSLEKSLENFEHGIKLIRQCQYTIKQAEQKVQILMEEGKDAALQTYNSAAE